MINISGFGLSGRVIASNTFPNGFDVTAFADDMDPLDSPDLEVADTGFGLNGDMVTWSRPTGIEITLGVIPNSEDDRNFAATLEANRVAKGKRGARDVINIVMNYPNGDIVTLSQGVIVRGRPIQQVASSGRLTSKPYTFRFGNVAKKTASEGA
ncbi:hypothetical protein CPT_Maja_018 [Burkholderia phage Maja]|uniref:Uncharacterized protein n=1 Tax=Burkholderia phage Maja TaxID=2767571 RepID=A0A7S6R866_9CAUD|nr:hypothetical protein CPT_Maja_018 [Burkholderia phage Maja]